MEMEMKKLTDKFINNDQEKEIIEAVKKGESITSGEIVPMIVNDSYDYRYAQVRGAIVFTILFSVIIVALIALEVINNLSLSFFLIGQAGIFLIFYGLLRLFPSFKRFFIYRWELEEEVAEAAFTNFYQQELNKTRDRTGILIYISLYERNVLVMADSGINEKLEQKEWDGVIATIIKGIKEGKGPEAICIAVDRCAELLADHFPIKKDDTDELKNLIVE
jgi:putative membrane protein